MFWVSQRDPESLAPLISLIEDDVLLRSLLVEWLIADGYRVDFGVPIIAISGQFNPGVDATGGAAAALNVGRVIAKPFEREAMLHAVRSLIARPG